MNVKMSGRIKYGEANIWRKKRSDVDGTFQKEILLCMIKSNLKEEGKKTRTAEE